VSEVVLLGTGAADGWPNPWCGCASCSTALAAGDVRGCTAALVDGLLLLDCGPEAPRAALRAGRSLAGVRRVLLTHDHPDHLGPAVLLWRAWTGHPEVLDVLGPPEAVDACRAWVGPRDRVALRPVQAGAVVDLGGGYVARALAGAHERETLLWDVTTADGSRLLHATDTGPLPEAALAAVAEAAYDLVLLEETFGDVTDHATGHLDLRTFPAAVAALRRTGAVTAATRVVAVHLGHRNPPAPELARRLAAWGAELHRDGAALAVGTGVRPLPQPRRTLVLGGARSGKSTEAERLLAAEPAVTYVATGGERLDDSEWRERVSAHRARRPAGWSTVETTDLAPLLRSPGPPLLVDCLSLWLAACLDAHGAWDGKPGAADVVEAACSALVEAWRATPRRVVAVSNEVGSGVVPATRSGRVFRDALGRLNAAVAGASEDVRLVVAGRVLPL
jgi:adenosylcobinamide kinase / adenosylcobinamide-phosphate guanylyltransferase